MKKKEYQNNVKENYISNFPIGIAQGLFFYAGMGFYNYASIFASFIFDLSKSELIVGLMGTVMSLGYTIAQIYGPAALEHLVIKRKRMLTFGFLYRVPWLLMGVFLLAFPAGTPLVLVIVLLYAVLHFFNGLYISSFFDFMSKIVPIEKRGTYFGLRNSISIAFQAGAGYLAGVLVGRFSYLDGAEYVIPHGYAYCFFLAFLVHMIDLFALSRLKEEPAVVAGKKTTVLRTLKKFPAILQADKNFAVYCVLRSLISLGFYTASFIIVFAKIRIPVTGEILGIFTAVNLVSLSVGTFAAGQIANKVGFKKLVEGAAILIACVYFTSPLLNSFEAFFVFFLGVGFLTGGIFLSFDNLIMEFGRSDNRPSYIAISSIISGITGIVGPLAAGLIANQISFIALFYGIGMVILAAGILMISKVTDPREIKEYWL